MSHDIFRYTFMILSLIVLVGFVISNASGLYAGESLNITDLFIVNECNITGNISYVNVTAYNSSCLITLPKDSPLQSFNVSVFGYKHSDPPKVETTNEYSFGGTVRKRVAKNVVEIVNKTEEVVEDTDLADTTIEEAPETEEEIKNNKGLIWIIISVGIILAIGVVVLLIKFYGGFKNE